MLAGNRIKRLVPVCLFVLVCAFFCTWRGTVSYSAQLQSHIQHPSDVAEYIDHFLPSHAGDTFVKLKNGLVVLVRQKQSSPVVSCQVFVHTGSIYEDKYFYGGISHYLEHVVAGGTTTDFTEDEAEKMVQEMGGASNAYTSYNKTVYFINTTSAHYLDALNVLLSYVTHCAFSPKEIKREKGVIQQEFKLGENNPGTLLWRLFMKTVYRVHPIRHPVIGYERVFVTISRDDLIDYYKKRYQPQNMVIVTVGNVDPTAIIKRIGDFTKDFTRRMSKPIGIPEEPEQVAPRRAGITSPMVRLSKVMVGYPSVKLSHPDLYSLDVLAMLLGRGRSSRLYKSLKNRNDLVLSVSCSNWTPSYARGVFIVSMSLREQNIEKALDMLEQEIESIKKKSVSEKELEKAKKEVVSDKIFSQESVESMASSLASSYVETGDPYFDDEYVAGIQKVTVKDIRRVAKRYLNPHKINVVVLRPEKKRKEKAPGEALPGFLPKKVSKIEKIVLSNGMVVLVRENHEVPVFTVQLYGRGGQCYEPKELPGISNFTFSLLTKGTESRTKEQISEEIEGMGASLSAGSGRNTYYVSGSGLSQDFDKVMEIFSDVVRNPSFPEQEIIKEKQDTILAIKKLDENWQTEVVRFFKRHYFHNHPYRNDLLGTVKSVSALTRKELVNFYRSLVMPNNAVIAVFGDVTTEKVLETINRHFRDWEKGKLPEILLPDESAPLKGNQTFKKTNEKVSASIFLGTNGTTLDSKDRPALDVIDAIISGVGYPSGWLQESLRGGNHNLVYVVHAFPFYGVKAGFFGVMCQTTMKNLEKVLQIINQQLDRICRNPVSEEELERGKDMVITMFEMGLETNEEQAQDAALNEVLGLGYNYDKVYKRQVKQVTTSDVLRVAKKYFGNRLTVMTIPEKPVDVVIPPTKRVGSDIR